MEAWSGGILILGCFWIFLVCIILGCGMPTMTIYFTVAIVAAPALIRMGAPLLSSHLFVMWAGIFSFITPPVAIASMVCAKMAGAPFVKTGMLAVRFGGVSYILPFLIILCPAITFQETGLVPLVTEIAGSFGILFALSIAIEGYWIIETGWWERGLAFLGFAAFFFALLIKSLLWMLLLGFAILVFITIRQHKVKSGSPVTLSCF